MPRQIRGFRSRCDIEVAGRVQVVETHQESRREKKEESSGLTWAASKVGGVRMKKHGWHEGCGRAASIRFQLASSLALFQEGRKGGARTGREWRAQERIGRGSRKRADRRQGFNTCAVASGAGMRQRLAGCSGGRQALWLSAMSSKSRRILSGGPGADN